MTQAAGQAAQGAVQWYHPGEVVVVARVPAGTPPRSPRLIAQVRDLLPATVAAELDTRPDHTRSFAFDAPGQPTLLFVFCTLADRRSARTVKDLVDGVHQELDATAGARGGGLHLLGAMPHWHTRAHEGYGGGSPGSFPRPVYADQVPTGWTGRFYQPIQRDLDTAASVTQPIPVAVLDTLPDLASARQQAAGFAESAGNHQLRDTLDWLTRHADADASYADEAQRLAPYHAQPDAALAASGGEPPPYPMPDHGLFVAGLIHGIAPRSPLTLAPALNGNGVGDLSGLLLALERLLARKRPADPLVINLSLGFLPHPARLPAAWYGLRRPNDAAYLPADELFDPARDHRWVAAHRDRVGRTVDLLELGLRELGTYLSLNNCLVVAAAGNDSLAQVDARRARMEPRLPARFESVLGVAATTSDPRQPARYSNVGDERELGDHVATFGGNASDALEPEDGVIGIYASSDFPDGRSNETGWAYWSGTSFATGIVSGIAANFWATARDRQPDLDASAAMADLHDRASQFGPYVAALRTPSLEVRGRWRR